MMRLICHGGRCCGIKTAYGLGASPESFQYAISKVTGSDYMDGSDSGRGQYWYRDARPEEKGSDRLLEYIEFCKENRTTGILEVVIQTPKDPKEYGGFSTGQAEWIPWLLENGFVEVNAWPNSNSRNICRQFVLNWGKPEKKSHIPVPAADWWATYGSKS